MSTVTAWASFEVTKGWLLPEDAADVIAKAEAFDGPWSNASCYDTANATGNEDGPLSSPIRDLSFQPQLPLGA